MSNKWALPNISDKWVFGLGLAAVLWPVIDESVRTLVKYFWEHSLSIGGNAAGCSSLPLPHPSVKQSFSIPLVGSEEQKVERTLTAMAQVVRRDAADSAVRDFAAKLAGDCAGHDFECEIERCFEYVRDGITYRRDPATVERVQDTRRTLFEYRSGDCDDKCVALAALLGALGHKSRFVVIGHSAGVYSHVYLEALTRRGWIPLDPTSEQALVGWEVGRPAIKATFAIF